MKNKEQGGKIHSVYVKEAGKKNQFCIMGTAKLLYYTGIKVTWICRFSL